MSNNKETSKLATAALVLGIIAVVLSFVPIINNLAFVMGGLALIFAIITLVKKKSVTTSIIALVLAIASMGITLAMQKSVGDALDKVGEEINQSLDDSTGKNTDDILKNDLGVTIGEFTVTESEYGLQDSKLVVTVTNKTAEKGSFSVKVEAVDADGKRIDDDTLYANDLGAGQSQDFTMFTLVSSDKYEDLKTASFKVVSATK